MSVYADDDDVTNTGPIRICRPFSKNRQFKVLLLFFVIVHEINKRTPHSTLPSNPRMTVSTVYIE